MRRWTLTYHARPISLNDERKQHWSKRSAATDEWRKAFAWLALAQRIPPLNRVEIEIHVAGPGRQQDTGNCLPSSKAGVDGLVDARVIPDDTPEHVLALKFYAPTRAPKHSLSLTIVEVA